MVNYKNPKPQFEEKKPLRKMKRSGGYFSKKTLKRMMELIKEGKKAREEYSKNYGNTVVC